MWRLIWPQLKYLKEQLSHTFKISSFTVEYPFVVRSLPIGARAQIKNDFRECTGCLKCEDICPTKAIEISGYEYSSTMKRPQTNKGIPHERFVENFKINYSLCVFCGYCVEACPTGSLTFSKNFVKSELNSASLIVDLVHLPRTVRPNLKNVEKLV